jgi:hypothetical protein
VQETSRAQTLSFPERVGADWVVAIVFWQPYTASEGSGKPRLRPRTSEALRARW